MILYQTLVLESSKQEKRKNFLPLLSFSFFSLISSIPSFPIFTFVCSLLRIYSYFRQIKKKNLPNFLDLISFFFFHLFISFLFLNLLLFFYKFFLLFNSKEKKKPFNFCFISFHLSISFPNLLRSLSSFTNQKKKENFCH